MLVRDAMAGEKQLNNNLFLYTLKIHNDHTENTSMQWRHSF